MAFGFPPKHTQLTPLDDLTHEQFLVIAAEAVQKLGWEITFISQSGLIAQQKRSTFSWGNEIEIKFVGDQVSLKSSSLGSGFMDLGKNKKNILKLIDAFHESKMTLSHEQLAQGYEVLKTYFDPTKVDILRLDPLSFKDKVSDFFWYFTPSEEYFITPILMNINILLFIIMSCTGVNIFEPGSESLLKWGANFRPSTLQGEWWRLLTNCFLHIGIIHLMMNMIALVFIGLMLEPILGKVRYIAAYLLAGLLSSVTSLWWHDLTICAGASGAIFGMYGVFLALLTTKLIDERERSSLLASIGIFVGYNLLYGMKGGIDNAAHIGGLLSGIAIGYAFVPSLKKPGNTSLEGASMAILAILALMISYYAYHHLSNDVGKYYAKMEEFSTMEDKALAFYNLSDKAPKDSLITGLTDKGIYYWNESIKLLDEVDKLDLPTELHKKNKILQQYCEVRIKCYEIMYKAVTEESEAYHDQMRRYNNQIDSLVKELDGE